jgi:outer membrane autotransporter protein
MRYQGKYGWSTFATIGGGHSRYDTGSHSKLDSFSLMAGLAKGIEGNAGKVTLGAFFEYGYGDYDTYNSFAGSPDVNGDGRSWYAGGGILGRMDFRDTGSGHFHAEAGGRLGRIHNKYDSGDIRDMAGVSAGHYDISSAYYSLHAGTGYIWNISERSSLDLYGKYFWTRQNGKDMILPTSDPLSFDDANSSRVRLGGRFAYAALGCLTPYAGAAWEYEFDGKAKANTYGYAIDAPSLKGGTGVGELGVAYRRAAFSADLGIQGYVGKREGVTGSLRMAWDF